MQKPSIPKGTRDFSPQEMAKRNYIFDTIKHIYQLFGFHQIETPAMENLSSLMGKYGEEGDKLLFKILNSGDYLKATTDLNTITSNSLTNIISEKGLRYDLTVPFARYVVQHRNDIQFPFKRYQIQPVWRADRPQKGRYREFFQCDADIIGSTSLINEVELIKMIDLVFTELKISTTIKLNNRKILAGIAEIIGYPHQLIDITVAMDKIDKIGEELVYEELRTKGISNEAIELLKPLLNLKNNTEKLEFIKQFVEKSEIGCTGIKEFEEIQERLKLYEIHNNVELDLTLARGLNYYTGTIIEVVANDINFGSICGGGRYDNLTSIFGLENVSGVGISFGADRIYDVMEKLDLFPKKTISGTKVLIINFGKEEENYAIKTLLEIRKHNISAELFPESTKIKKQMEFANHNNIPFVIIIGSTEIETNLITIKNMETGNQETLPLDKIITRLININ